MTTTAKPDSRPTPRSARGPEMCEWLESAEVLSPPVSTPLMGPTSLPQSAYESFSSPKELWPHLQAVTRDLSGVIAVSEDDAYTLLVEHKWDQEALMRAFVRDSCHKSDPTLTAAASAVFRPECKICLTKPSARGGAASLSCGHRFCRECWAEYCRTELTAGKWLFP